MHFRYRMSSIKAKSTDRGLSARHLVAVAGLFSVLATPVFSEVTTLEANGTNSTSSTFSLNERYLYDLSQLDASGSYSYNYLAVPWTATANQTYYFGQTTSSRDTVMILYSGVYDPTSPGTGKLVLNDDTDSSDHQAVLSDSSAAISCGGVSEYCPQVAYLLVRGQRYTIVITTYSAGGELGTTQVFYAVGPGAFSEEVVATVSAENTRIALSISSGAIRNQLIAREAVLTTALGYDSKDFGSNDISVSFVGRYTGLSDSTSEGAGAIVAAYKVHPNVRLGAFVDYAPGRDTPTGVKHSDTMPTVGAFAVYEENADLTGLNTRVAGAYNHGRMTVTRDASLTDTEAGSGKAGISAFGLTAEAGYGVRIAPELVAVPYLGMRYTDATRKGYTEGTSDAVTEPLTYNDYGQKLTTALGGIRFHGKFGEKVSAFVGLGAEFDVSRKMDRYTGTSAITDLETFSVTTNSHPNRLRASASAGVGYQVAANQSISAQVSVRQQAYSADPSITSMVKYSMGF